jgi:hypothetical protein
VNYRYPKGYRLPEGAWAWVTIFKAWKQTLSLISHDTKGLSPQIPATAKKKVKELKVCGNGAYA